MGNDLSSCMDRMRTDDAPIKTRHLGDSVATQTGEMGRARLPRPLKAVFEPTQHQGSFVVTEGSSG